MTEAAPRKRRRRRLLLAGAAVVVGSGLALGGVELWLRAHAIHPLRTAVQMVGMYEADGDEGIRPVAGYRGTMVVEDRTLPVRLNSLGGRGPEPRLLPDAVPRVLFLGDSMVFGYGVAEDESAPAALGRELDGVAVGNAGVSGFAPVHFPRVVDRWRRGGFPADAAIACLYLGNDFEETCAPPSTVVDGYVFARPIARAIGGSWRARLALHSYTFFHLEHQLRQRWPALALDLHGPFAAAHAELAAAWADFPAAPGARHAGIFMDAVAATPELDRILARTLAGVRATAEAVAPAPLLLVVLPTAWHVLPGLYSAHLDQHGWQHSHRRGVVQARILAWAAAEEIAVIDFTATLLQAADPAALYLPTDRHPTAAGHALLARVLAPRVRELLAR